MVELGHPPRVSKERVLETLHLQLCAPQIYPDRLYWTFLYVPLFLS